MLFLGILFSLTAWSQTKTVTGMVLDEATGSALAAATVSIKGTTTATQTSETGEFAINASATDVLVISFTGYAEKEVTIGAQESITVTLAPSGTSRLDEVVVVGYGTQRRSKITGSVSKLDDKILETGMRSNPAQALAGTIPGLRVSTGTGRPGSLPAIVLRGGTNFDGSGSPLILLDGQVRSSLSDINPDDLESVEVLKDASATAIYGARASNGVILLTSKKGKMGSSSLELKAKIGVNYLNIPYEFLDAGDYVKWTRLGVVEAIKNGTLNASTLSAVSPRGTGNLYFHPTTGQPLDGNYDNRAVWSLMRLTDQNRFLLDSGWHTMKDPVPTNSVGSYDPNGQYYDLIYKNFNYGDYAFKSPAISQDYNLTSSGGNDRGKYYSNIGYYNEDGLSLATFYRRVNATLNGSYNIKPWLISESGFQYTMANWRDQSLQNGEGNYWGRMLSAPPTMRGTSPNGELLLGRDASDGNPIINIDKYIRKNQTDKFTINQAFTVKFLESLNLRLSGILYYNEGHGEAFNKDYRTGFLSLTNPNAGWNRDRQSSASFDRTINQTYNAILNYNKQFGLHTLDAMAGTEFFDAYNKGLSAGGRLAPTDDFMDLGLTQNTAINFTRSTDSWHERDRIISGFGRLNYDYDDKYLATFTIRRDGVSRLSTQTRYGTFPAVSLGWVLSRENFMESVSGWMNYLKLRASWGKNGNIGIGTSSPIGLYEVQGSYGVQSPYNSLNGFLLTSLSNPTLEWEKTNSTEVGFDMGFLNNRIYLSAAYYDRLTTDKLAFLRPPASSGINTIRTNNGSMKNRGVELDLTARIIQKADFQWTVNANAAWNKNKIVKLPFNGNENNRQGGTQIYDPSTGRLIWVGGFQEGQEWGEVFGYVSNGIIRNENDLANYNKVDLAAGEAQYGNAAGRRVASQKIITDRGLTNFISTKLGDMMWKDMDKNDTIDFRDRVSLGRVLPRWTGGFNTTVSYKGVSLFLRTDFALGHIQQDQMQMWALGSFQGEFNATSIVKDTWTPENPNAPYPRYTWADQLNTKNFDRPSNMFWVNSGYLAFREVTLSYSVPRSILSRLKMNALRLSVTGQNLGYITNSLINLPERTGDQNSAYTIPTTLIFGANITF
ncbi:MAG: SusC/RagA family TonB-linked outer membrane protein [Sphingobacteriales bacterium 41-5]|nr:MAG: SusC/RagA family TonB-linked outer membrane protein [Sphingobacteriales bacterium 41-5]